MDRNYCNCRRHYWANLLLDYEPGNMKQEIIFLLVNLRQKVSGFEECKVMKKGEKKMTENDLWLGQIYRHRQI